MRVVISIAGFDPSGGAGVLADIKTIAAFGCYGVAAITSITSQNTLAVYGAYHQPGDVLRAQIDPILEEFEIAAVKIGMLSTFETISVVAEALERWRLPNIVLDPVIRSTSGYDLIDEEATRLIRDRLFPLADLMTPNMAEAERLTGLKVESLAEMEVAGQRLTALGARAVLVKGGHLKDEATDLLIEASGTRYFPAKRIETRNTHGTGCRLSSAIAALLATGYGLHESISRAKVYLAEALLTAPDIGHRAGPLNHPASNE